MIRGHSGLSWPHISKSFILRKPIFSADSSWQSQLESALKMGWRRMKLFEIWSVHCINTIIAPALKNQHFWPCRADMGLETRKVRLRNNKTGSGSPHDMPTSPARPRLVFSESDFSSYVFRHGSASRYLSSYTPWVFGHNEIVGFLILKIKSWNYAEIEARALLMLPIL